MQNNSFKESDKMGHDAPFDLADAVDKYLKFMQNVRACSEHTLRAYRLDLEGVFQRRKTLPESEILPEISRAQSRWRELSFATRNRKIATLKSFLGFLCQENLTSQDLRHHLISPKVPKRLPHYIGVDEVISVLAWIKRHAEEKDRQAVLLFYLLYGCGLRISEACGLKRAAIDIHTRTIRVTGKGNKDRVVAVPDQVMQKIVELSAPDSPTIWGLYVLNSRTGYEHIRQLGVKAGLLKPLHPHALRHSFATHLLSSGANLRTLQELLGHSSLSATERYTHLTIDQLARTMEKCHPLSRKR